MLIYTGCPACGKSLTIDLRHKEPYAVPGQQTAVAIAVCEGCRNQLNIDITITGRKKT